MTDNELRDWFAGQALAGLLASLEPGYCSGRFISFEAEIASDVYGIADALMAQRVAPKAPEVAEAPLGEVSDRIVALTVEGLTLVPQP